MANAVYEKLPSEEVIIGNQSRHVPEVHTRSNWQAGPSLKIAFVFSLCLNIMFVGLRFWAPPSISEPTDISMFAGLPRDTSMTFEPYSRYGVGNTNETDRSIMWESLSVSNGEVALDKQWASAKGLPESRDFPWDRSKGSYLLTGHHSLHCLRKVRRWVTIAYHNGTQLDAYSHVVHCMSLLLHNVLCEADDTPMYVTASAKKDAGYGQTRKCRSWDALNAWAESQTACYGFINETQGINNGLERYKWCPQGSTYAPGMREVLGLPPDWYEDRPSEIASMPPYWEDFKNTEFVFHELTDV